MYERSYITLRDLTEHIQTFSQLLLYSFFSPIGLFFFLGVYMVSMSFPYRLFVLREFRPANISPE